MRCKRHPSVKNLGTPLEKCRPQKPLALETAGQRVLEIGQPARTAPRGASMSFAKAPLSGLVWFGVLGLCG